MKKSYFWGLLFAIMALIPAQNAFADYCTVSSNSTHAERRLQSFTLTDGVNDAEVASIQTSTRMAIYQDKTSVTLTTSPGATISFKALDWKGSWMHAYVFVDYDNDQTFDNTTNELVSYNFYSPTDASSGVNSKGESVTNNCGVSQANMPSWTLPSDLEAGTYRLRFKVDWNSIDPCGDAQIASNGGVICDMTLNVTAAIPERTISVDVVPAEGGVVTGAGTALGNITLTATPNPGYDFVNWTLDGTVVGTDLTYTDATEGSKTYTANFAALTSYPEMSYFYTNGVSQSNRYLKEVTAVAGDITTTVFSATTEAELPRVDPTSIGTPITEGALIDKTATPIVINEGTTSFDVTFKAWTATMSLDGASKASELQWTQQAAFIDWNNNYYFYDENENYGKSSNTIGNDGGVSQSFVSDAGYTRTFTVPEGVQPGTYRMRVSYSEPDGNNETQWQNSLFQKGNCTTRNGKTYDFAIEVRAVVEPSFNVSVSVNDAEMGSATKQVGENDEITLTATAKEGYEFVNWTVADAAVSTENPYVFTVEADVEVVANFQAITNWPATMTLIEKAKTLIAQEGVGYPSATAKATFQEALDAAEANTTIASLAPLQEAIDAYLATEDITLPEAGKTYAMVLAVSETSLYYMNNNNGTLTAVSYDGTSELPDAAKFTAVYENDKYAFQSVIDSKYMAIPSNVDWLTTESQSATGLDEAVSVVSQFDVLKLQSGSSTVTATEEQLFGMVYLYGSRGIRTNNGASEPGVIIISSAGAFDKSGAPFCNGSFTSAIRMIEVEYTPAVTKYAVSATSADATMGTATVDATEVEEGAEATFTATANAGYKFTCWTAGTDTISTANPYVATISAETALTANFDALTPSIIATVEVDGAERSLYFSTTTGGTKFFIDWGNGVLVETEEIMAYDSCGSTTTVTGTPVGEGIIKVYGDNIAEFNCSSMVSGSSVTALDLTNATSLLKLYCYSNKLTTLDLSKNTELLTLSCYNNQISSLDLSQNTQLTRIEMNNAGLTSIDLSYNTALTYLDIQENPSLGAIDLSANTLLTTVYVNNIGLTSIDLSNNTALKYLYANTNQLTTVDVSKMVAGSTIFADDNKLTELVTASEMLSKAKINILRNNFTMSTLPVLTGVSTYNYAPQQEMAIATEINEGEELDLSSEAMVGENATDYTWYWADGTEFTDYTEADGKFVFNVDADSELYCTMTNASFDKFSGANALKTTNIVVRNVAVVRTVKVSTNDNQKGYAVFVSPMPEGTATDVTTSEAVTVQAIVQGTDHEFVNWTINGEEVGTETIFVYTGEEDATIVANFQDVSVEPTTYNVTVKVAPASDWGTASIEGAEGTSAQIEENASVTVVATPAEGYEFEGWYDTTGANLLSTELSYTFTVTAEIEVVAWFQEPEVIEPSYCTDFGSTTRSNGDRKLTSVTFSDGANEGTVAVNQSAAYGAAIYYDATETEISLEATKEITANINWAGTWMHSYLYIDFNDDKEFTPVIANNVPAENSELVSYSFWTGQDGAPSTTGASDERGYNSLGQLITGDARANFALPVFTIPTTVAEGTYRARFKIDWNTANPCAINATSEAPCVVDFMLTVTYPDGIADADVDGIQVYATDGVIYINGYEGEVKVVNAVGQVVKDVYVNGAEQLNVNAGLYIVVTGDKTTKVVVK